MFVISRKRRIISDELDSRPSSWPLNIAIRDYLQAYNKNKSPTKYRSVHMYSKQVA